MTNQRQSNGGKENDTPKKPGNGEMTDVPAFDVQASSPTTHMPDHLIKNHDRHQKQQAQQQQEHQQKQATKNTDKTGSAQQGDASIEQKKQQQQEDKYQQLDQQDHLDKEQDKSKRNQKGQQHQQQPKQQQQAQPQQFQSSPTMDAFKGKWEQQVGAAKVTWGKLTDDELLQSEGHLQKLSGLVQERYAISRAEADKQVKAFIDKCKC